MTFATTSSDRLLSVQLGLAQYPILSTRIRVRMRAVLFERGIVQQHELEAQVRDLAVRSQEREGVRNPLYEEAADLWELRLNRIRDQLTDVLFSRHLTFQDFEQLVNAVLEERGVSIVSESGYFNPELAPQELVFEQGLAIEHLPPEKRARQEARLQEIKVVLIRTLISDQLRYINIAKEWFTIGDLAEIRRRKIGAGRIGGKAAGMLLALRILNVVIDESMRACLSRPDSYFIGSDMMYSFMAANNLIHWNDQKYKTEDEMRHEYPQIVEDFEAGAFPPEIQEALSALLVEVGRSPLIVRSSSLLEDNFGTSFAGKYESVFLPNQGTFQENLAALLRGIARIYASTLNPNALLYRRSRGLQDYDERMAILIQVVEGEQYDRYYLPHAAGVAFSRNLYRWTPQIRKEDGFLRLVWGLGTRAVDRVGNDYPRLIALSHPLLRPSNEPGSVRRYSQQFVDLIDLEENQLKTLPVHEVLKSDYAPLRYIAQMDEDGYFSSLRSNVIPGPANRLVLTFEDLLRRTSFAAHMTEILRLLERAYRAPVDMEFTLSLCQQPGGQADVCITILQCRPQSVAAAGEDARIPSDLKDDQIVFSTQFVVPQGRVDGIDWVVYVPPEDYFSLPTQNARVDLARTIGRLNNVMAGERFICVGPGRWGSSNSDLGVPIDYGDIYNARSLVELAGQGVGPMPEPSLGTHFFQDLLETNIYPLAVVLDSPSTIFNGEFFKKTPNRISQYLEVHPNLHNSLKLIRVADFRPNHTLRLVMSDELNRAVAYLVERDQ